MFTDSRTSIRTLNRKKENLSYFIMYVIMNKSLSKRKKEKKTVFTVLK